MSYIGIKIDMVNSRYIKNREEVQQQFLSCAERINMQFENQLASRFVVTHGDEAQCMVKVSHASTTFSIIETVMEIMHPVKLRFGVGRGSLSTTRQSDSIGMDGPVWHLAKQAIEKARRDYQYACFEGFSPPTDSVLGAVSNLLLFLNDKWTAEQREVINLINQGKTQARIAEELGLSRAAISKRFSAAGWRQYSQGRVTVREILEGINKQA